MTDTSTAALIQAIQADARRLGLTWALRPATTVIDSTGIPKVRMDGDTVPLTVVSLIGTLQTAARVMVMLVPPSGAYVIGYLSSTSPSNAPRGQIAYVSRDTSSTSAAGATGVLRLDGVPVYAGRRYEISTNSLVLLNTVAVSMSSARLAYDDTGAVATSASTPLPINNQYIHTINNGASAVAKGMYEATTDTTLSVLLFTLTVTGAGLTRAFTTGGWLIELWINDMGTTADLTGTGTIL